MPLPVNIVDKFEKVTKFNLSEYLTAYANFIEFRSTNITDFYLGVLTTIDDIAFNTLDSLYNTSKTLQGLVDNYKSQLTDTAAYWELLEMIEDISISLSSLNNARKWTRSSISKSFYDQQARSEVTLTKFQTLEDVSSNIGANDRDNYWLRIALDNDLREEDYSPRGEVKLLVRGANRAGLIIKSVLDTDIVGEKIYGKDVKQRLEFDSLENDLVILSYQDTLKQTVSILSTLVRGDNPEFKNEGIQSSLITGSNRGSISYPILLRQYYETFSQDDSFKSILIKDISLNQDSISLTLECETKIGEIVPYITRL